MWFVLFVALGCSEDKASSNENPVAKITSHSDGDVILEGETITIRGVISDEENNPRSLNFDWLLNDEFVCNGTTTNASGEIFCEIVAGIGEHTILLEVFDPDGASHGEVVILNGVANIAPQVTIDQPTIDGWYYSDVPVAFSGSVLESESALLDVIWRVV